MFTGIIETTGIIENADVTPANTQLTIKAPRLPSNVAFSGPDDLETYGYNNYGLLLPRYGANPAHVDVHKTNSSIRHFFRRAYLHGKNDFLYLRNQKKEINFSYWLRKIDFADLSLVFLVLLHFSVQRAAQLFQKILRPSTR